MLMVILPKLPSFWAQPVPAIVMAVMQAPAAAPIGTWSPHHRPGLRNVYAHCAQVSPWLTLHTMVTTERAVLYAHFTAVHVSGRSAQRDRRGHDLQLQRRSVT